MAIVFCFICIYEAKADESLAYNKIPSTLLKNADAVIRELTTEVTIVSPTEKYV